MTPSVPDAVPLLTTRPQDRPLDPADELAKLRAEAPVSRLRFPDGHVGWLITGYEQARAVLADARVSARYEFLHHPLIDMGTDSLPPAAVGEFIGLDPPEHTRFRKLLTGKFTVRRMRRLTDRLEHFTAEHLVAMRRQRPPVDLVPAYAKPIPALMICELLGVPYADRDRFQADVETMFRNTATQEETGAAMASISGYLGELVAAKRAEPTDDLLSDLTTSDLTEEELVGVGGTLLAAGLDTTSNMISLGTYTLLRHPERLAAWREDRGITESAVEELLRYLTIATPIVRSALADIDIAGETIRAGESVVVAINAANRDPARFADPDTFDPRRQATGQLAFGHGVHQCLGQQLARVELRVALPALLEAFPTLRLAVPPEEVPMRHDMQIYGVHQLQVTWDG